MISLSIAFALGVLCFAYSFWQGRGRARLPPGPPGLPIIGNLLQAPKGPVWVTFKKWTDQYGPLVYANFAGNSIVIVGDYDIAKNLLDKRANVYSSRPRAIMAHELTCRSKHYLFRPFDTDFLLHQRLFAPLVSPRASACYRPIQDMESKQLLINMLQGGDFVKEFDRFAASVVYTLTFGLRIVKGDEWQLRDGANCVKNLLKASETGAWIVDILPFLNYLPAPLAPWKKTAEKWYQTWTALHQRNMHDALQRPGWNWTKELTRSKEAHLIAPLDIAWDLGISCDGGVETTSVQLRIFILACLLHPSWIPSAQQELDDVVGPSRLPTFNDLDNLPYITAVLEEVFRWRHITPMGVPHATQQDDVYNGYLIPKNATIIPLYHTMRSDPQRFDNTHVFQPERWLANNKNPPPVAGNTGNFGYGRRVCPGRFIGRNSMAIVVARLLWAFEIRALEGVQMGEVNEEMFLSGLVSEPKPFGARFDVRGEERRRVIERECEVGEGDVVGLLEEVKRMQKEVGLDVRG